MSNNLTLADAINAAFNTGQHPTFIYEGETYTFSPEGIVDWLDEILNGLEVVRSKITAGGQNETLELYSADGINFFNVNNSGINSYTPTTASANELGINSEGVYLIVDPTEPAYIYMSGVPTVDPQIEGVVWSNNGVLTLSEDPA